MRRVPARRRRGAVTVEAAFVLPVALFLILGLVVGGLGIFRYQETAWAAREGARYAAVRGSQYAAEVSGATAATPQDVYNNAILPSLITIDPSQVSYSVTWNSSNDPVSVTNDPLHPQGNTVTVTVTYTWMPELFLIGPITFTSSSTLPMAY
jgi:Flp pilus assembly protein TadG